MDDVIRISTGPSDQEVIFKVFVHELAHHVDEREGLSDREDLIEEQKKKWKKLGDNYAKEDVSEYIAIGFEIFYCGTRKEKSQMRRNNPRLYSAIKKLHRKYRSK